MDINTAAIRAETELELDQKSKVDSGDGSGEEGGGRNWSDDIEEGSGGGRGGGGDHGGSGGGEGGGGGDCSAGSKHNKAAIEANTAATFFDFWLTRAELEPEKDEAEVGIKRLMPDRLAN